MHTTIKLETQKEYKESMVDYLDSYLNCINSSQFAFEKMEENLRTFQLITKKNKVYNFVHFMELADDENVYNWEIDLGEYYGIQAN